MKKLVRRHPHVFGADAKLSTPHEVRGKWEEMKASERSASATPKTILSGVPKTLPSLLRAYEYGARAAAVGFDWVRPGDVVDKIEEEVRELREARQPAPTRVTWVTRATRATVDRRGAGRPAFRDRQPVAEARRRARGGAAARQRQVPRALFGGRTADHGSGQRMQEKTLDELEATWQDVKHSAESTAPRSTGERRHFNRPSVRPQRDLPSSSVRNTSTPRSR